MNVMQSYSLSLNYTSLRMYVSQTAPATVPSSPENAPAAKTGDTVTLSPEATAPPVVDESPSPDTQVPAPPVAAPESPAPSPEEVPSAPTSRAERRAEALLGALDADQDGAITREEFLDGAMALLRRAGARRHRGRGEGHDHHSHEQHGMRGLERKLDRLFERVDGSGDGNVDQSELTDALMTVTREPRPDNTEAPAPSAPETPAPAPATESEPQASPATAMSYTSVTVVIAVRQYTSVAAMAA